MDGQTDGPTDQLREGPTDRQTDRPTDRVTYRVACTRLKTNRWMDAHMHTCTHAHMHACTHARMHACTHAHMHTCTHVHMHTCTHARMHTCTHGRTHACMHTQTQARMHARNSIAIRVASHFVRWEKTKARVRENDWTVPSYISYILAIGWIYIALDNSHIQMGRGIDWLYLGYIYYAWWTDQRADGRTDRPTKRVTFRVACTQLEMHLKAFVSFLIEDIYGAIIYTSASIPIQ